MGEWITREEEGGVICVCKYVKNIYSNGRERERESTTFYIEMIDAFNVQLFRNGGI